MNVVIQNVFSICVFQNTLNEQLINTESEYLELIYKI